MIEQDWVAEAKARRDQDGVAGIDGERALDVIEAADRLAKAYAAVIDRHGVSCVCRVCGRSRGALAAYRKVRR